MNVKVRMSRAENIAKHGTGPVTLDMEEYLCGVVPAEMYETAAMDALKVQAIAARTYALKRALAGTVLGDTSGNQAYKVELACSCARSRQAVMETKGVVLCYQGKVIDCFYSASNGGVTKRSGDVWKTHYPYYVNKIDEWDVAANRETPTKVSHGVGMSQIGAMWAGKQGVPYAKILAFYYEGATLVAGYGQGGAPSSDESRPAEQLNPANQPEPTKPDAMPALVLRERIMTRNDSYAYGRKIVPKGIMVHSTAAPGVMAAAWFDRWNRSYKKGETTRQVSVHAFLDDKEIWQYLPWDQRAWHAAGTANDTHVAFELCEPSGFKYAGGATMVGYDVAKNEPYFRAVWKNAVALCVLLCRRFSLTEKDILCHSEGYKKGIANNHADVLHWFPKHGENMDTFRAAVKAALAGEDSMSAPPEPASPPGTQSVPDTEPDADPKADYVPYTVKTGDTLWSIARDRLGTGTRYKEIIAINGLKSDTVRLGQVLYLPE